MPLLLLKETGIAPKEHIVPKQLGEVQGSEAPLPTNLCLLPGVGGLEGRSFKEPQVKQSLKMNVSGARLCFSVFKIRFYSIT